MAAAHASRRFVRADSPPDTSELLRNATRQVTERGLERMVIVDADAHHYETDSWGEINAYIEDPVIRRYYDGVGASGDGGGTLSMILPPQLGSQDIAGRIPRYRSRRREATDLTGSQRTVHVARQAMDAAGIDYQVIFPTPMLYLGLHPRPDIEVAVARAYTRWLCEQVIADEPRLRTMVYLPFNDPDAALRTVREFSDAAGVAGFMVTTARYRPVHDNVYVPLYRELEERGLPLGFHAGYTWLGDRRLEALNSFASVHAIGFVLHSLVHLTNWVMNGMPERFPRLKVLWIETGLACMQFLAQRLDHEFAMRSSEAPMLKRLPSEYMREMYYTSQPLEVSDMRALQETFRMINAESQLLYASDYPHWDFDLPSRIYDLPFLDDRGRENILGRTACRLFDLGDVEKACPSEGTCRAVESED